MNLLIAGSRTIKPMNSYIDHLAQALGLDAAVVVIHGGAPGVDTTAGEWASEVGYDVRVYPADWERYGKSAGFRRNQTMVDACDAALVIWDGQSRGSKHTLDLLHASGKPYIVSVLR